MSPASSNGTTADSPDNDLPYLECRDGVVLLKVRAQPGASRDGIVGRHADRLKVAVVAAPEDGKANESLRRVVAKALGLRRSSVILERGATAREKVFRLEGATLALAAKALRALDVLKTEES